MCYHFDNLTIDKKIKHGVIWILVEKLCSYPLYMNRQTTPLIYTEKLDKNIY